jgi:hypothetical protein
MYPLCVRCQVRPWWQERTRVTILVIIVIILVITAVAGWTLADVAALITATYAAAASVEDRKATD